jgi:glycosyltransferase involved in cell wall biosynthesis
MGLQCTVLNIQPRAPSSSAYVKVSGRFDLMKKLARHVLDDWTLSVHINGHNPKSWSVAVLCGVAAHFGCGGTLTVHSGMAPEYLRGATAWRRTAARLACVMYSRVVCVNEEIADSIAQLGIQRDVLDIKPAYEPVQRIECVVPEHLNRWMSGHPVFLSVTLSFRPEYGFELLMDAVSRLKRKHPGLGCLVMGTGEDRFAAQELIHKNRLDETVFLAGDLDHQLCLTAISRSAAFVRPTFRDGDSISVREAIALGVPVVASNVGTRPAGTLLFEAGNIEGLVRQVEAVLAPSGCDARAKSLAPEAAGMSDGGWQMANVRA